MTDPTYARICEKMQLRMQQHAYNLFRDGKKIDIVPHTGIAVFGKEYFFGGGPQIGIPGQSVPVPVAQVLELGQTSKTCEELETYIRNVLSLEHTEQKYDLLKHNCNHYADDVAKFLLDGRGLPSDIVNIAEEALSTPQGQSLKVMIENIERSMRSGGTSMNPFGSAASVPTAPLAAPDESSGELKVALAELAKNETEVRRTALQMLLKMTKNVEDNPSETKFRRIKMANPAVRITRHGRHIKEAIDEQPPPAAASRLLVTALISSSTAVCMDHCLRVGDALEDRLCDVSSMLSPRFLSAWTDVRSQPRRRKAARRHAKGR
eukprot:s159_g44.t1